eukprot:2173034-Heterocapsa_arctica.AAC.1
MFMREVDCDIKTTKDKSVQARTCSKPYAEGAVPVRFVQKTVQGKLGACSVLRSGGPLSLGPIVARASMR